MQLSAGWRQFISWLSPDARTGEVYRLAHEKSAEGVRPQGWLDGFLGTCLDSEPMYAQRLHGIDL